MTTRLRDFVTPLNSLILDVRHASRGLVRSPGLAVTAVLTLSLGVGANLTVFSVVDAAVLKPLPYPDPDELVVMYSVYKRGTAEETFFVNDLSWNRLDRWRAETHLFASIATYGALHRVTMDHGAPAGDMRARAISPEVFSTLGVPPKLGRWFDRNDIAAGGTVALLTEAIWRRTYAADPGVIGRPLTVEGKPHTIIGVMPETFGYGIGSRNTIGWIPYDEHAARLIPKSGFSTVMRLRPGLSLEQAERELDIAAQRMQREQPSASPWNVDLAPLDSRSAYVATRTALAVFSVAVALILLIACANVANLLLSRTMTRRREIAVRSALGASRLRVVRHLVAEGLVLAAVASLASLALAWSATRLVPALVPADLNLFAANPMTIDWRVLVYALSLVAVTTLLCSAVPAMRATREDLVGAIEGSGRIAGTGRRTRRLWQTLQAVQILLTVVLLTGAGLLASSFIRMIRTTAGYDVDALAVAYLDIPEGRYASAAARGSLHNEILMRVRALPRVHAAAYGASPPSGGAGQVLIADRELPASPPQPALSLHGVGHDYFATTGIPLKQGRLFTDDELRTSARVVLVDERFAQTYWPGESALGKQLRFGLVPVWSTVVGVVGSVKTSRFALQQGSVQAYYPVPSTTSLIVKSDDPLGVIRPLREAVKGLDRDLDVSRASLVGDLYEEVLVTPRFYVTLMVVFGALALVTAAVGLAAVISHGVARRSREIGVRLALGAQVGQIRRLVMRDAVLPVVAGAAAGVLAALWLTRFLQSMLYEITPHDPATYAAGFVCLAVVVIAAASIPAERAARLDPVKTLRNE